MHYWKKLSQHRLSESLICRYVPWITGANKNILSDYHRLDYIPRNVNGLFHELYHEVGAIAILIWQNGFWDSNIGGGARNAKFLKYMSNKIQACAHCCFVSFFLSDAFWSVTCEPACLPSIFLFPSSSCFWSLAPLYHVFLSLCFLLSGSFIFFIFILLVALQSLSWNFQLLLYIWPGYSFILL